MSLLLLTKSASGGGSTTVITNLLAASSAVLSPTVTSTNVSYAAKGARKATTAGSSATNTLVSDSFTPTAANMLVVAVGGYVASSDAKFTISDTFGDTGGDKENWKQITNYSETGATYTVRSSIFYRRVGNTPSSGTVTVTRTAGTVDQWITADFMELQANNGGVIGFKQAFGRNNASAAVGADLPHPVQSDSLVISALTSRADADMTQPTNFTTISEAVGSTSSFSAAYRVAGGSQTVDWTGAGTTLNTVVAVEFAGVTLNSVNYVMALHGSGNGEYVFGASVGPPLDTPGGAVAFTNILPTAPRSMGVGAGYRWRTTTSNIYDWTNDIKPVLDAWLPADCLKLTIDGFSSGGAAAGEAIINSYVPPYGTLVGYILEDPANIDTDVLANPAGKPVKLWASWNGTTWNDNDVNAFDVLTEYETLLSITRQRMDTATIPGPVIHSPMTGGDGISSPVAAPELLTTAWWTGTQTVVTNLVTASSTVLSPTVNNRLIVVTNVVTASSTVPSPQVYYIVAANAVTASATVRTPTVVPGSVTVITNLVTASSTVLNPTITVGSVTVVANVVTASSTVPSPQVYYIVAANVLSAPATVRTPTVVPGSVTVVTNVVAATSTVLNPTITTGSVTVITNLLAAPSTVPSPQVYYVTKTNVVTASSSVLTPQVYYIVATNVVTAAANVRTPTVIPGSVTVVTNLLTASSSVLNPTVVPGSVTIVTNVATAASTVPSPQVFYVTKPNVVTTSSSVLNPTIVPGSVTIVTNVVTASSSVLNPTVVPGSVTVVTNLLAAPATVRTPAVAVIVVTNVVTASSAVLTPQVYYVVATNLVTASSSVLNPTITTGSVTVVVNVVAATSSVLNPLVAVNSVFIFANLLAAPATVLDPTVSTGAVVVTNLLAAPSTVQTPAIQFVITMPVLHTDGYGGGSYGGGGYDGPVYAPESVYIVVLTQTVEAQVLSAPSTVNTPSVYYVVAPNVVSAGSTVLNPTVTPGSVTVVTNTVTASSSILTPAVAPGSVTVVTNLVTTSSTIPSPQVYYIVAAVVVAAGSSVLTPTVVPGSVTVVTNVVTASSVVQTPTVVPGSVTVVTNVLTASSSILSPTVINRQIVDADVLTAPTVILTPTIINRQLVDADVLTASSSILTPTVINTQIIVTDLLTASTSVLTPTVANTQIVVTNLLTASSTVNNPLVTRGMTALPDVVTASSTILSPQVYYVVKTNLVAATSSVLNPAVRPPVAPFRRIAYVGASTLVASTATGAVSSTLPTGLKDGDYLLLQVTGKPTGSAGTADTLTVSSPWVQVGSRIRVEIGTDDLCMDVYERFVPTAVAGMAAPTVTAGTAFTGTEGFTMVVHAFRGVDATTPKDVTSVTSSSAAAATFAPTGVTTTTANAVAVSLVATADDNALNFNTSQSFILTAAGASYHTTTGTDLATGAAVKEITAAGVVTMPTWNESLVGTDAWVAMSLALRPAASTFYSHESWMTVDGTVWDSTRWPTIDLTTGAVASSLTARGRFETGTLASGAHAEATFQALPDNFELNYSFEIGANTAANECYLDLDWRRTNASNRYFMELGGIAVKTFGIYKVVAGVQTTIKQDAITVATGDVIHVKLRHNGAALQWRWWKNNETDPVTWSYDNTQADFSSGSAIFGFYGGTTVASEAVYFKALTVEVTIPAQTVVADVLAAPTTVLSPTVVPGSVTVVTNVLTAASTVLTPRVLPTQTVVTNLVVASSSVLSPQVYQIIVVDVVAASSAVLTPTVAPGAVTVVTNVVAATSSVLTPTVRLVQTVVTNLLSAASTVYTPNVKYNQTVVTNAVAAGSSILNPTISTVGTIAANVVTAASVVYQPSVSTITTVTANKVTAGSTVNSPAVQAGSVTVVAQAVTASSIVYGPNLVAVVAVESVSAPSAVLAPGVSHTTTVECLVVTSTSLVLSPRVVPSGVIVDADVLETQTIVFPPKTLFAIVAPSVIASSTVTEPSVYTVTYLGPDAVAATPVVYAPQVSGGRHVAIAQIIEIVLMGQVIEATTKSQTVGATDTTQSIGSLDLVTNVTDIEDIVQAIGTVG